MGRKRTGCYSRMKRGKYVPLNGDPTATIYYEFTIPGRADGSTPAQKKKICCETCDEKEARERVSKYLGFATQCSSYEKFLDTIIHMGEVAAAEKAGITADSNKTLIADVYDAYTANRRRPKTNEKGMKQYGSTWKRFAGFLPANIRFMEDVTVQICEDYIADLEAHYKYSSCSKMISQLKTMFTYISSVPSPFDGLKVMKPDDSVPHRRLTTEESNELVKAADTAELKLLFKVGYYTGLRLGHAVNLRIEQFDLPAGLYLFKKTDIQPGKEVPAVMPLHPALQDAIEKHLNETNAETGKLFPTVQPTHDITPVFTKAKVKENENGGAGFHALRVSFDSMLEDASVSHTITKYLMGHSLGKIHKTYTRLEISKLRPKLADAIPALD